MQYRSLKYVCTLNCACNIQQSIDRFGFLCIDASRHSIWVNSYCARINPSCIIWVIGLPCNNGSKSWHSDLGRCAMVNLSRSIQIIRLPCNVRIQVISFGYGLVCTNISMSQHVDNYYENFRVDQTINFVACIRVGKSNKQ